MRVRNGDILGYARVSTATQDAAGQQDRLRGAAAIRVFVDVIPVRRVERQSHRSATGGASPPNFPCTNRHTTTPRTLAFQVDPSADRGRFCRLSATPRLSVTRMSPN